jgi:23S rRNA (cytosine1962-C5)-methyltransferase
LLSPQAGFVILTAYAIRASALSIYYAMHEMMHGRGGRIETGELTLREKSAGRLLSTSLYARWSAD